MGSATEARALGCGWIAEVACATGLHPATISSGLAELDDPEPPLPPERVRRSGDGRKAGHTTHGPAMVRALEALVEPTARAALAAPGSGCGCGSSQQLARIAPT